MAGADERMRRPLQTANLTSAVLFRVIDAYSPTLLIDEFDTFGTKNPEMRGIINSGHSLDGAFVMRCAGDNHTPTKISTWAPKALCGIGKLPETIADRSIPLRLQRRLPKERVASIRREPETLWQDLRSRIVRFVDDHAPEIAAARALPIDSLGDRVNDAGEPLLAIAETIGGKWPKRARRAAITLHADQRDIASSGTDVLAAIRSVFDSEKTPEMHTATLLERLIDEEDGPWGTWKNGKPLNANQLPLMLDPYGVFPKQMRIGRANKKGYQLA